jgi:hypothetical protein
MFYQTSSDEYRQMSHDFAFWQSDEPLESDEAGEIYAALVETGFSERVRPSPVIALLAHEIESRWPMPGPGQEDQWPLAAGVEVSKSHLIVCLVPSRLMDVWPMLGQFAKEHELVMYDPQQQHVFLPLRLSRKRTRARAKKKRPPTA